jgi:uncharacterized protein
MIETPQRGFLANMFLSPDERRLRGGWRLLIHAIVWIALANFATGLIVGIGYIGIRMLTSPGIELTQVVDELSASLAHIGNPLLMIAGIANAVGTVIVTWLARRFLDKRSFVSLGHHLNRRIAYDLLFGFALGGLLMGLIYGFESLMGWLKFEGWASQTEAPSAVLLGLGVALMTYIAGGYQEELLSRGYQLQNLWDGLNLPLALIISSFIFMLLHSGNPNMSWGARVGLFLAGFFLAYPYIRTGELWLSVGLHIGWNFFQGTIFGFGVSGLQGFHLIEQSVDGPVLITGGAFGPEAGLISWAAMLLGTALIWLYTRNRPGAPDPKSLRPASPPPADPVLPS